MTARMWVFTVNGRDLSTPPVVPPLRLKKDKVVEFIMQMEIAPETGRFHYQGFVRFSEAVRMSHLKKALDCNHAHCEICHAPAKAREYAQKDETRAPGYGPIVEGVEGGQGKRTDIDDVCLAVRSGASLKRIAEDFPKTFVKMHKGISALRSVLHPPLPRDVQVFALVGPTGCGKTRFVVDRFESEVRNTVFDTKVPWFDGYDRHPVMLIDEFGPGQMSSSMLKKVLDRYDLTLPIKGGSVPMCASLIFLTSNYDVDSWYPHSGAQDNEALKRRMTIIDCTVDGWQGRVDGLLKPLPVAVVEEEVVPPPSPLAPVPVADDLFDFGHLIHDLLSEDED